MTACVNTLEKSYSWIIEVRSLMIFCSSGFAGSAMTVDAFEAMLGAAAAPKVVYITKHHYNKFV